MVSPGCPLWLSFHGPLPMAPFGIDPYGLCRLCSKSSLSTLRVGYYLFLPFRLAFWAHLPRALHEFVYSASWHSALPCACPSRKTQHLLIVPVSFSHPANHLDAVQVSILNPNTICLAHTRKHQTLPSLRQPWCSLDKGVGRKVASC